MISQSQSKVINVHHFGSIDKLPSNSVYIGRPGPHGNAYSSQSGVYTKEECIALHRVDLYHSFISNPSKLQQIRNDLSGKDLACWCKQPKRIVGCHGDTYLHVLSDPLKDRVYDKSVLFYLMDDLRSVLKSLLNKIHEDQYLSESMFTIIHYDEVKLGLDSLFKFYKDKKIHAENICTQIAVLVIDLELAYKESDLKFLEYRFDHVLWNIDRFIKDKKEKTGEPQSPHLLLKRKKL